jgi:hypothetical protein
MKTTDSDESVELESAPAKVVRLTFLGSLAFWPLFVFGMLSMLGPPGKATASQVERNILVYGTWFYPVAVVVGWLLSKRAMRRGRPDFVCLLPWLIPTLMACYWVVYFFL